MWDHQTRIDEAVRQILRSLLDAVERNEPGVRADLTPDSLHDFRVAIRRTRTIFGQVKTAFPVAVLNRFRPEFKWLAGLTGPTRDLDVFVERVEQFRSEYPDSPGPGVDPLLEMLTEQRGLEYKLLIDALDRPRYSELIDGWRSLLNTPVPAIPEHPAAWEPVLTTASRRISSAYSNVLARGTAMHVLSRYSLEAVHRLRIACKRLRYLVEAFARLYDENEIDHLIRILKRLQDAMGDFHDIGLQQDRLRRLRYQLRDAGEATTVGGNALDAFESSLDQKKQEAKMAFVAHLREFAQPDSQERFARLFSGSSDRS